MKKLISFVLVIVLIFGALVFVTSYQKKQQLEGNPFGKKDLHPETIEQLNNEVYQNIILPEQLEEKLAAGEATTVYFYSPKCDACHVASPRIVSKAKELDINVYLFNILEFPNDFKAYNLKGTPTVIHYEDGEEVDRITGLHEEETYQLFYEYVVLKKEE